MVLRRSVKGHYLDGRPIAPPKVFLGAAAAPFASRPEFQALREHKKVNAGAQFFQTNLVYDADGFEEWLNELAKRDILDKVFVLVGVTPLKSLKMAQYMHHEVPGVVIPSGARAPGSRCYGRRSDHDRAGRLKRSAGKQGVRRHLMAVDGRGRPHVTEACCRPTLCRPKKRQRRRHDGPLV